MNAESLEVTPGEVGELLLRGPHVSKGYWNNPEATAAVLDSQGWFHTGDLARRDEDGFFYIAGRSKDMFISGGVNVYPAEIEGELLLHPEVRDAAVIGVPHPVWGEIGVAFVVPHEWTATGVPDRENVEAPFQTPALATDLATHLTQRIARFKVPKEFLFVESLPRTPYGKVAKAELRSRYEECHKQKKEPGAARLPNTPGGCA